MAKLSEKQLKQLVQLLNKLDVDNPLYQRSITTILNSGDVELLCECISSVQKFNSTLANNRSYSYSAFSTLKKITDVNMLHNLYITTNMSYINNDIHFLVFKKIIESNSTHLLNSYINRLVKTTAAMNFANYSQILDAATSPEAKLSLLSSQHKITDRFPSYSQAVEIVNQAVHTKNLPLAISTLKMLIDNQNKIEQKVAAHTSRPINTTIESLIVDLNTIVEAKNYLINKISEININANPQEIVELISIFKDYNIDYTQEIDTLASLDTSDYSLTDISDYCSYMLNVCPLIEDQAQFDKMQDKILQLENRLHNFLKLAKMPKSDCSKIISAYEELIDVDDMKTYFETAIEFCNINPNISGQLLRIMATCPDEKLLYKYMSKCNSDVLSSLQSYDVYNAKITKVADKINKLNQYNQNQKQ